MKKELEVYINIDLNDVFVGILYLESNGNNEVYSFSFNPDYLKGKYNYIIDPSLYFTSGRQFRENPNRLYGFIEDVIPDRWGKKLLDRKYNKTLYTYDYLTLISDVGRMGSLRFKEKENNYFYGENNEQIPSLIYLNKLEQISLKVEDDLDDELETILNPGSSLGGARPKANIFDNENNLYIAKFPSKKDLYDVEMFECIANDLAFLCEIDVPEHRLLTLSNNGSTLLLKRFDREKNIRYPFVSMMSLLSAKDGESESYSYIDLVDVLSKYSSSLKSDLLELYKRLIFNVLIHNGDDHLRNHGMVYINKCWRLSKAYDLNPSFDKKELTLSIDGENHSFDLKKVIDVAPIFGLKKEYGESLINKMKSIVFNNVQSLFDKYKTPKQYQNKFLEILNKYKN